MLWSVCIICFVVDLNFNVCNVVSCSSFCVHFNHFVLLSLCAMPLLRRCVVGVLCVDKNHKFDASHFCPNLPQRVWQLLNRGVVTLCMCECLVFAFPLVVLRVKPLFAFLMFLYACVGCTLFVCLKVNWSASQLSKCNLCFAFWRLFWCSSQVLLCFNVSGWMYMLSFVFPCTLPCPTAFLVLRTCCTS